MLHWVCPGRSRYYKVCSLGPNCDNAGNLDANNNASWQCIVQVLLVGDDVMSEDVVMV